MNWIPRSSNDRVSDIHNPLDYSPNHCYLCLTYISFRPTNQSHIAGDFLQFCWWIFAVNSRHSGQSKMEARGQLLGRHIRRCSKSPQRCHIGIRSIQRLRRIHIPHSTDRLLRSRIAAIQSVRGVLLLLQFRRIAKPLMSHPDSGKEITKPIQEHHP